MSRISPVRSIVRAALSSVSHLQTQRFANYANYRASSPLSTQYRCGWAAALSAIPQVTNVVGERCIWTGANHPAIERPEPKEIERVALPPDVPTDRFRAYEIQDSAAAVVKGGAVGENAVLTVHGPSEVWAPHGLVEGHGAGGGIFAIIATGGNQYKVSPGDVLYTNHQRGEVNSRVIFDSVLLVASVDWSVFGRPVVGGARVLATIEEQTKTGKIYIVKFKKRTGYRRKKGHRQLITRFRIDKVEYELPGLSRLKEQELKKKVSPQPERNIRFPLV